MEELKIGFIQATNNVDAHWFRPLTFGYLKAYLNKNMEKPADMSMMETAGDFSGFNVIAISSTSQDFAHAIKIAREAKNANKEIITIIGGHHVTYLAGTLPRIFNLGVLGEGEQTLLEVLEHFQKNGFDLKSKKLRNIRGLAINEDSGLFVTPKRELIEPLDSLPHPGRQNDNVQYLFTSRGCPYKCAFCSSCAFWRKTRTFSAEYVLEEMEQLLEQFPETQNIPIQDDLFIVNRPRFKKIIELIEHNGINKKVAFSFAIRANLVDDELCELIKRLNVTGVSIGAESASDRMLNVLKKKVTAAQNQNALDMLHRFEIPVACSFIVGIPSETEQDVRATYEFIIRNISENKLSTSSVVNILMPMPGTEMWDHAINIGLVDPASFDWNRLAVFASYRHSNIQNFSEWAAHRTKNGSLYLNEETLPQQKLYEIMSGYDDKIIAIETSRAKATKTIGNRIKRFIKRRQASK